MRCRHHAHMTSLPPLFLSREAQRLGSDRQLRRRHADGSLTRIATGVYVETQQFAALEPVDRYRLRVRGLSLRSHPGAQFSHDSAAAEWGLTSMGAWPRVAHQVVAASAGGASRFGIHRHAIGRDPDAVEFDGLVVTSLARTVIDMASTTPFVRAVAMADHALRHSPGGLDFGRALEVREAARGAVRASSVIEFASPLAGSPGESFARVQFLALGYPAPELQVSFAGEDGFEADVDFYFRDLDLIVEFDGLSKYGPRREFQRKLTLDQMLLKEKAREDQLRRMVRSFARITWALAADRHALANHLRPHGLIERGRSHRLVRERISDSTAAF